MNNERIELACMLMGYVATKICDENLEIRLPPDSFDIYDKCIGAAFNYDFPLNEENLIKTEEVREWAHKWAAEYYESELVV